MSMSRNMIIGMASGVATAVALGYLFGTENGRQTYRRVVDKVKRNGSDMGDKMQASAEEDDMDYPNPTSKTVAE